MGKVSEGWAKAGHGLGEGFFWLGIKAQRLVSELGAGLAKAKQTAGRRLGKSWAKVGLG